MLFEFSSCNKDITIQREVDNPTLTLRITNPFDYFGVSHNNKMDYVAGMTGFDTASLQSRFTYGNGYSDVYFSSYTGVWSHHTSTIGICIDFANNTQTPASVLFASGQIDASMTSIVFKMDSIFDHAIDVTNETYKSVAQFTSEVEYIEGLIANMTPYSYNSTTKVGNKTAFLLGGCAIAKHSYAYWIGAANDVNSPWHTKLDEITSLGYSFSGDNQLDARDCPPWLKRIGRAIKVAAVDVWGFIAAEDCGKSTYPSGYDLGCAWENAGDKSGGVN